MIKFSLLLKKLILSVLIAALALGALPLKDVLASGLNDPANPSADTTNRSGERLEKVWARLQRVYERQGKILDRANGLNERAQGSIDKMEENGKDVAALQATLDAFEDAIKEAHPIYESAKGIINSHNGFNSDGKVTDQERAFETVKELGAKIKEVREITGEPGKALREAIKAYRESNRPADTSGPQG